MANNEASDLIEAAIEQALPQFEEHEQDDMVVEWVVIAYVANAKENDSRYPMLFSNGNLATHRARGLLHTGLKMLNSDD